VQSASVKKSKGDASQLAYPRIPTGNGGHTEFGVLFFDFLRIYCIFTCSALDAVPIGT
jgi:hypothetical protein